jgi:hypothetical protein
VLWHHATQLVDEASFVNQHQQLLLAAHLQQHQQWQQYNQ